MSFIETPPIPKIVLSKDTIKRLVKDVRELMKSPLKSHGIYYEHSKEDILSGQAMIIGPSETPYERGYYFFEFNFPTNYPYKPPIVTFHTNDGTTRFNPNLYKSGKVCLSILNTWEGDQWSGCQSISSVLLALCTILNKNPLLNEPGITEFNEDFYKYNKIITFMNIKVGIVKLIKTPFIKNKFKELYTIMIDDFLNNFDKIIELVDKNKCSKTVVTTNIYKMSVFIDYSILKEDLYSLYNQLFI